MAKDPEKIELRLDVAKQVKETVPHATSVVETVVSLVNMVQKINDLGEAREALGNATDLFKKGETDKARDLAFMIFERLKQVGKMPEKLDTASIQRHADKGEYKELVDEIKKVSDNGEAKNEIKPIELSEKLVKTAELKVSTVDENTMEADKKNKNEAFNKVRDEITVEVKAKEPVVAAREKQIQAELVDLLGKIETKTIAADVQQQIHNVKSMIDAGFVGNVDAERQIELLKDRIKENKGVFEKKGNSASVGDWAGVMGKVISGNADAAREQIKNIVGKSAKGEQIFVGRLTKLLTGMEKVKEGVAKGLGVQEAVRALTDDEIREVRAMLSSTSKIDKVEDQPPYYDEKYVEFMGDLKMGKEELVGFMKVLDAVDVSYQRIQVEKVVTPGTIPARTQRRERGTPILPSDRPFEVDAEGNALYGMKGRMSEAQVDAWIDDGREYWNEVMEEVNGTWRPKSNEQVLRERRQLMQDIKDGKVSRNEQRESFLNINMNELFDYMQKVDADNGCDVTSEEYLQGKDTKSMFGMIDYDYWLNHQVAKLKDKYMNPVKLNSEGKETDEWKAKENFETWWYQEVSFNQRSLAYEGLFERRNQSPRMQRLNSLMEIIGVSTSKKGLANWMAMSYGTVDQQNNSYVNAEFMGKLATFWTNQGVDFRLDDMLKGYREEICFDRHGRRVNVKDDNGDNASISVYDTVSFMQQDVTDELRKEFEAKGLAIPSWWKGKIGTLVYKYSDAAKRAETRGIIWKHFLKKELGVDFSKMEGALSPTASDAQAIENQYSLMFDLGFQYSVVHKQLNTMIGNASFVNGEIELPAACAEMHLKLDPLAYPKLFAPRFQFLNVTLKEIWSIFDTGVRDHVTMAPQDFASHLTELSIGKDGQPRRFTDNGSPTIGAIFLGGSSDSTAEKELKNIFDGEYDKNGKLVKEGALWHWGRKPGEGQGKEMDIYLELGVYGDKKSAFRRSGADIRKHLRNNIPGINTLKAMEKNWGKYFNIIKNPRVQRAIEKADTAEAKWLAFADSFGEYSFIHDSASTKRSGDLPVKYGVEKFNKHVEAFLALAKDPFNQEKLDALLDVPTEVNAAIISGLAEKNLNFILMMSQQMGRAELFGKSMQRFDRAEDSTSIAVDTSYGLSNIKKKDENGEEKIWGGNEWPAIKTQDIKNSNWWFDSVQNRSIPESVGVGIPVDKQILLDLIKGQRANNRLSNDQYRKFYKKIINSVLKEKKKGPIVNAYRFITLQSITDWLGPQMGITGYELRKVIGENTEKTVAGFFKYLNG